MTRQDDMLRTAKEVQLGNYAPAPFVLTHGRGRRVTDASGRQYLDLSGGISVLSVGHSHPTLAAAIGEQAARLMRNRSYGPEALRSDVQDLTARGFQYASDITEVLLAVFFELLPSAARGQTGPLPFSPLATSAVPTGGGAPPG